mmetsp:Transcript_3455/g.6314  ORF Transcript_3455/g.6314 Transcript_3455/m.6314 type:complete len:107 (+) Transcript_3455:523-843(+)
MESKLPKNHLREDRVTNPVIPAIVTWRCKSSKGWTPEILGTAKSLTFDSNNNISFFSGYWKQNIEEAALILKMLHGKYAHKARIIIVGWTNILCDPNNNYIDNPIL